MLIIFLLNLCSQTLDYKIGSQHYPYNCHSAMPRIKHSQEFLKTKTLIRLSNQNLAELKGGLPSTIVVSIVTSSWRPPATRVSCRHPSHVAVHFKALQNNSTFCVNPTSTITMFGTSVMPTAYSDSSKDNPMKFEFPRSSTHWFMSLLNTLVPGRL